MPTSRGPISNAGKFSYVVSSILLLLVGFTLFSCMFGGVAGTEFNPYTFQSREFSYLEMPIVGVQVWPTTRTASSNALQDWITTDANVLNASDDSRWDLVDGVRMSRITGEGNSATLHEYLTSSDSSGNLVWLEWSQKHPKLARKFWPMIAWLAREDLYFLIPDFVEVAKADYASTEDFQKAMETQLREQVQLAVTKMREAEDVERARALEAMLDTSDWRKIENKTSTWSAPKSPKTKKGVAESTGKDTATTKDAPELPAEAPDPGA